MEYLSRKSKTIVISALVIFSSILIIVALLLLILIANPQNKKTVEKTEPTTQNQITQPEVTTPPKPIFDSWVEAESVYFNEVEINPFSSIYTFKTNYSDAELNKLSNFFGFYNEPTIVGKISTYTNYATDSASLMVFDNNNSSLSYFSADGLALTQTGDKPSNISEMISPFGLYDQSIKFFASYKRKDQSDVRYYEFHRAREQAGYPILNPVGLLNLSENQLVKDLDFISKNESLAKDEEIYETSDNKDGYVRADDFNTMTVGIDEKRNKIISIISNIRPFTQSPVSLSKNELLTKDEALEKLKTGNYEMFLPTPSGEGVIDFKKVFPGNLAKGKQAVINEIAVVYLELPSFTSQTLLQPYYLFRGYSELDSGYRINFVAAVRAQKNSDVAGVSTLTQGLGGQQQGTLKFSGPTPTEIITIEPTEKLTVAPTEKTTIIPTNKLTPTKKLIVTPTSTTFASPTTNLTPTTKKPCAVTEEDFIVIYEFEGMRYGLTTKERFWYLIPDEDSDYTADEYIAIIKRFIKHLEDNPGLIPESLPSSATLRNIKYIIQDIDLYKGCPINMTGHSPSLFIYGSLGDSFTIEPDFELYYNDPPIDEGTWNVDTAHNNYIKVNNILRKYIYYEYKPVGFSQPTSGWVIDRNKLSELSAQLASALKLNNTEISRLLFELKHASSQIKERYLFVGIINESEINRKLPLNVTPTIENIQRYHFYVKGLSKKVTIPKPILTPVVRTEKLILELGAIKGE